MEDVDLPGERMMLRGTDVSRMMARVESTLLRASRSPQGAVGVMHLAGEGDDEVPIAEVRADADIKVELPSGSARPVVGPVIRYLKRVVRRGLRWYLVPIIAEQSRFNHAVLDLLEGLRMQQERLRTELDALAEAVDRLAGPGPLPEPEPESGAGAGRGDAT